MDIAKDMEDAEQIALVVQGGIGRNIMATAVVRSIKAAYPEKDLTVVATCPDVFLKNPHIRRVVNVGNPLYFFEDYILESKTAVLNVEPYTAFNYVYGRKHFVECWCDLIGVPCTGVHPELYFTDNERSMARVYLEGFDRKMVLFQHNGGKKPDDRSEKAKITAKSAMYRRSLPEDVVTEITDALVERGFMVGSVGHDTQFHPSKAEIVNFPVRSILALLLHVPHVLCIDSFLYHGATALGKRTVCMWGGTNPKVLGYGEHRNLTRKACPTPMCHRPNSYLFDIQPTGFMWECQFDDRCMDYSSEEILKAFDEEAGGEDNGGDAGCPGTEDHEEDGVHENRGAEEAPCEPGERVPANSGKGGHTGGGDGVAGG